MTENEIHEICKQYDIKNYQINPDMTVDVIGDVILSANKLTQLPLKFSKVSGYFDCAQNNLTTLDGCPQYVGGNFSCILNNELTTLEGCPNHVVGNFWCSYNNIRREKITVIGVCRTLLSNNLWKF